MARLLDLNYMGTFLLARAALPHLLRAPRASLIIVSSIVGRRGLGWGSAYAATKFAQVGLAESLRVELAGTSVRVGIVFPVSTETEFRDAMAREQGFEVEGHGPAPVGRAGRARHRARHRERTARDLPARRVEAAVDRERRVSRAWPIASSGASAASRSPKGRRGEPAPSRRRARSARRGASDRRRRRRRRRPGADRRRLGPRSAARPRRQGSRPRGLRAAPAAPQEPARRLRIGQHRRRELHGLQGGRPGRLAAPPRVEDRARPQGIRGHRRPRARSQGGGAAPRLHDQRDLLGSAARDLLRSVQRPLRPRRPRAARRRSADVRRRQPPRAARDPVRRPLRGAARAGDVRDLPRHPAGRSAGRAHLGRSREAAAPGGAAVARPAARARPRHRRAAVAGAARAGRLRAGSGVAPRRRRVGAHADGRRRRAHSASRDWIADAR